MTDEQIEQLDFSKEMDFKVVGDIKPTIINILGKYETGITSDCALHLKGTNLSLPAYCPYLTYYAFGTTRQIDEKIIRNLLKNNLIELVDTSIKWAKI